MSEGTVQKVLDLIPDANQLYYRLILLVGPTGSGKSAVLKKVAETIDIEVFNANLALSEALLDMTTNQRRLRLPGILEEEVSRVGSPAVIDNLEILFDKELRQEPLRLLQGLSRNRIVIASWNGAATGGSLTYAEATHPEYRKYTAVDALIIQMEEP